MLSKTNYFLLALLLTPLSSATTFNQFQKSFSDKVKQQLNTNNIPGAAFAIVQGDHITTMESFGYTDKANSLPINNNTVFRLASVSKTFAATITTLLAQEKSLNLSDPITKYVPNFTLAVEGAAQKIQLKHILSHSSGLMPNAYDNLLHENWSLDKIIGRFDRITPICPPEKCYGYQNIAYGFLQPAIELSQNENYATLLQERIFTPLNMKNSSVGIDVYKENKNTAKPHVLRKRKNTGKKNAQGQRIYKYLWRTIKVTPDFYKVAPAAGINASIDDLAKWLIANLGYNKQVLSPALLDTLTTPRIRTKKDLRRHFWRGHLTDAHYGYGWRIYQLAEHTIVYHSGWVAGFRADIAYSPDLDIAFAIVMNAESNIINKISSDFWLQASKLLDNS